MIRGPIAYPGAKWKALDKIMEVIPDGIEEWREPFFGGGSVTLGFLQDEKSKDCKRFIVGELAKEVYSMWTGIQRDANKVVDIAQEMWATKVPTHIEIATKPSLSREVGEYLRMSRTDVDLKEAWGKKNYDVDYCRKMWEQVYKEATEFWEWSQSVDCEKLSLEERAARFYIVSRISFSSMADSGTLSKDKMLEFNFEHMDKILEVQPLLQRIEIFNQTFQDTFKNSNKEKGFIFLDPPYYNQEKSGLYGRNGDTHKGFPHNEFAELCKSTDTKWLITYDDSIAVRKLFRKKGIVIKPFTLVYTMAGGASEDALAGEEVFIANYDIKDKNNYDILEDIL